MAEEFLNAGIPFNFRQYVDPDRHVLVSVFPCRAVKIQWINAGKTTEVNLSAEAVDATIRALASMRQFVPGPFLKRVAIND